MSESSYPSDKQDKFMLRLPDGMRDRIKDAAAANNRSMNAEIVATLTAAYPDVAFDPKDAAREYREWAMFLLNGAATDEERAKAVARLNELDRLYKQATGENI